MNIEYWEIWNEPDLDPDDSANKRCWGGTKKQFFEFYDIAARHLKGCFPHLKIGGPALARDTEWAREFLAQLKAPLDFFSWHIYAADPRKVVSRAEEIRALMQEYGFGDKESILNEWNYVRGWKGDPWIYTKRALKGLKAASFIAASMMACQKAPVDMLMCYDCGYIEGRNTGDTGAVKASTNYERLRGLNFNETVAFIAQGLGLDEERLATWMDSAIA